MNDCRPGCSIKKLVKKVLPSSCKSKELNAENTRSRILQAAFEEMYAHGFQGMRIDNVLAKTALAKGALYHHFPNKKTLGYSVVDEIIFPQSKLMYEGLAESDDPIGAHCDILTSACQAMSESDVELGCPVNNLSQEMAGLDEGFKQRLCVIYEDWTEAIEQSLASGQKKGLVRSNIDPRSVSIFIISSMQGLMGTAKCMQSKEMLTELTTVLCDYLESLRA